MGAAFPMWSISRSGAQWHKHFWIHRLDSNMLAVLMICLSCSLFFSWYISLFLSSPQCTLVVTISMSSLSASRVRSIKKHQTPVVGVEYVSRCLEKGVLLPVEDYCLPPPPSTSLIPPRPASPLPSLSGTSQTFPLCFQNLNMLYWW